MFAYLNPRQFVEIRAQYVPPLRDTVASENGSLPPELAPTLPDAENSLFNTALTAGFAAQGARQLRSEMALVSNQVLVARAVDFGDPEAVRSAVEMTHDYLNLALEHLASGELDVGDRASARNALEAVVPPRRQSHGRSAQARQLRP